MKKCLTSIIFVAILTIVAVPANVRAETTTSNTANISGMLEMIQNLMKQVEALQKQLVELRGEIKSELRDGLREGMSDDDVKKIQELLATDSTIYPKGLISGYYGPLTKEAVMRLQTRHGLKATGEVDSETKKLILEYFKEKSNGKFPPGLLRAPGIEKKMLERMKIGHDLKCDDKIANRPPLCKKWDDDDDSDEDENDDDSSVTKSKTEAVSAINAAKDTIEDLEGAIAGAEDEDAIEEAEDELEDAEDYLADAEEKLAKNKYTEAYYKALKAKSEAKKGLTELL